MTHRTALFRGLTFRQWGGVFIAIVLSAIFVHPAGAISNVYFDNNDASGASNVDLQVGQTRFVHVAQVHLKAYSKNRGINIFIQNVNYCPGSAGGDLFQSGDKYTRRTPGENVTKYKIGDRVVYGKYYPAGNSHCNDTALVTINDLKTSEYKNTGRYFARIDVTHVSKTRGYDGVQNAFNVRVTGGIDPVVTHAVSATNNSKGYAVTFDQRNKNPAHTNYTIAFGSDCTVKSNRTARLYFYDIDNDGGSGAQIGGKVSIRLQEKKPGDVYRYIDIGGSGTWIPASRDNTTQSVAFTAKPGAKYLLRINNVYYNNTLQFSIPYDGIYFDSGCQEKNWALDGETDKPTYTKPVDTGTVINWKHHLWNKGADETNEIVRPRVITVRDVGGAVTQLNDTPRPNIASGWDKGKANKKDYNGSYAVKNDDAGSKICQYLTAEHGSSAGGTFKTKRTCVTIPGSFAACEDTKAPAADADRDLWRVRVGISTKQDEVELGDTMKWKHTWENRGPNKSGLSVQWGYGKGAYGDTGTIGTIASGQAKDTMITSNTTHIATQDDVGRKYYRTTWSDPGGRRWSPWSSWSPASKPSNAKKTKPDVPEDTNDTQYRRHNTTESVGKNVTYYWVQSKTRHKKANGDWSAWSSWSPASKPGGASKSPPNVPSNTSTTHYRSQSTTVTEYEDVTYYWIQSRTRTKESIPKIETAGCGILVLYDYELTPRIDLDSYNREADSQVAANGTIHNSGPTKSEAVRWKITRLVYPAGEAYPTNTTTTVGDEDTCTIFDEDGYEDCAVRRTGSATSIGLTPDLTMSDADRVPNIDAGGHVCYVLSVNPWRNDASKDGGHAGDAPTTWRHSAPSCLVVSRRPKFQVQDGDLRVGGTLYTSTSRIGTGGANQRTYGSWADYGVFSVGQNATTASGGGLRGGNTDEAAANWSKLTFANSPSLGGFDLGSFSSLRDYFSDLKNTATAGGSFNLSGGSKVIKLGADATIEESDIPVGSSIIVQAKDHVVTIAGDIAYQDEAAITKISDIPQVVIVAKEIRIENSVQRVDAWLLTDTVIDTCSDGPPSAQLTVGDCDDDLVLNGPVSTGAIHLRRTAGATGDAPEDPAEIIRLTPWTYLWLYSYANLNDQLNNTYEIEQPPRF